MVGKEIDLKHFREQLAEYYNQDELQTLCFEIDVEYENLKGETLTGKTRDVR